MKGAAVCGALLFVCSGIGTARADAALFSSVPLFDAQPSWKWVIGASLVALIVGFALGWRTLDRRIRKKYGGLKIY